LFTQESSSGKGSQSFAMAFGQIRTAGLRENFKKPRGCQILAKADSYLVIAVRTENVRNSTMAKWPKSGFASRCRGAASVRAAGLRDRTESPCSKFPVDQERLAPVNNVIVSLLIMPIIWRGNKTTSFPVRPSRPDVCGVLAGKEGRRCCPLTCKLSGISINGRLPLQTATPLAYESFLLPAAA
jgi:hypothetical protein